MKILFVNAYYYPDLVGGTEISVQKLAEELAKDNEVYVICSSNVEKIEIINGVRVYRLKIQEPCNKIDSNIKEVYNRKIIKEYKRILNEIKPDVVNTNNLYNLSLYIWKITYDNNIPIVHTIRDYYLFGSKFKQKNYIFRQFTKYIRGVIAASSYTLNTHIDKGYFMNSKNKAVIPNAIDIDFNFFNELYSEKIHKKGTIKFAFVGRYTKVKGLLFLIDTFIEQMKNRDVELHLFGKGDLDNEINSKIKAAENITNNGYLYEEELSIKLKDIDVLIVPTTKEFQEPFGRVVLDAYKHAIPVIASTVGGLKDIVEHDKTGWLIEPSNKEDLIEAINSLCNRNNIIKYIGNIGEELHKYELETQKNKFFAEYKKLINE